MKKTIKMIMAAILVATLFLALVACGGEKASKTTIGVQTGTTGEYYVKGDEDWGFEGFSNVDVLGYDNGGLAVQDLLNGTLDFIVIDEAPAKKLAASAAYSGKVKVIDIALTVEEYAFGVDKANAELETKVNEIIAAIKEDGRFDAILDKYFNGAAVTGVESGTLDLNNTDKQFVVATNANFAPFEYKIGDKYAGVDMEIAKIIADELGMELVVQDMEFASVVTSVGKNGVDIAMAGLTVNEKRKQSVNFSTSYYNASQMVIVKAGDTTFDECKTAEDVEAIIKSK